VSADLRRALRFLDRVRGRVGLAAFLQFATTAAGIGLMVTSARLISRAALGPSIAALQVAIVGVRTFGIGRAALRYCERWVSHDTTLRLLAEVRVTVYRAIEPLAPARLMGHRSGDLLERLVDDVELLENAFARVVAPALAAALVAALMTALALEAGTLAAAMALAGFVAAALLAPGLAGRLADRAGAAAVALRGELAGLAVDIDQGAPELVALGREDDWLAALAASSGRLAGEQGRAARAMAIGGALVGLATDVTAVATLAMAALAVRGGRLSGVALAGVVLLVLAAFDVLPALAASRSARGATQAGARRLFELVDTAPPTADPGRPVALGPPTALELRGLSFTYPGQPRPALDDVSLRLEPGRLVAVVGPSGSGKSTLAHLLMRFWDVAPGRLWMDGHDLRDYALRDSRGRVALVPQRVDLLADTLRANLLLARPSASPEEVLRAARLAGLLDVLATLPEGWETWIGEQGARLSGGERQRLALARALLKDAPWLVLDEPTSHLDPPSARSVLQAIRALPAGTLLISHALSGLECADEILVLDRGRVVERGSPAVLAGRGGRFQEMLELERETFTSR